MSQKNSYIGECEWEKKGTHDPFLTCRVMAQSIPDRTETKGGHNEKKEVA